MKAFYIFHKSPRLALLERRVWLAGKTCGSVVHTMCTCPMELIEGLNAL